MSYVIQHLCDGCGCKIAPADVEATNALFLEWTKNDAASGQLRQAFPETFCAAHREFAIGYWDARRNLIVALNKEHAGRLEKQRNRFWEQYKKIVGINRHEGTGPA